MKNTFYILFLLYIQFIQAQNAQSIIGNWSGWYEEGQKNYDVRLNIEKFNGIFYEGMITLVYEDKEAQFSIEGNIEKNTFKVAERKMISQYAPDYILNPQWCKADYEFVFSNLGDRFQLEGYAKKPKVNIAYVKGVKVYDSPKCTYFEKGKIRLQKKNPDYEGEVRLEKKKEKVIYVRKKPSNTIDAILREFVRQPEEYEKVVIGATNPTDENEKPRVPDSNFEAANKEEKTDLTENQGREVVEAKMIESDSGTARIQVWDNRTVDGDIISIYHNGKLIKENIHLLKEKKELFVTLEKGKNVIVMHAVNLGEIPPNSAAMNVNTGEKQYSMILKSDTQKSESIVIYYYP